LMEAIGFKAFTIRVNHRQLLNGLLERQGLLEKSTGILRALDKLQKIGRDGVFTELTGIVAVDCESAEKVLDVFAPSSASRSVAHVIGRSVMSGVARALSLENLEPLVRGSERGERAIADLRQLFKVCS